MLISREGSIPKQFMNDFTEEIGSASEFEARGGGFEGLCAS